MTINITEVQPSVSTQQYLSTVYALQLSQLIHISENSNTQRYRQQHFIAVLTIFTYPIHISLDFICFFISTKVSIKQKWKKKIAEKIKKVEKSWKIVLSWLYFAYQSLQIANYLGDWLSTFTDNHTNIVLYPLFKSKQKKIIHQKAIRLNSSPSYPLPFPPQKKTSLNNK